ncbi:MAG: hypothetical protein GXY55_20030 [Phycisphaerae bacterium]|nr:hypothetical protein [Phycisphaerae bacterium]
MLDFDRLTTPRNDGDVLIEPCLARWQHLLEDTESRRATGEILLAGRRVADLRPLIRDQLVKLASRESAAEGCVPGPSLPTKPLILTGHQPAFIHPGVWAKQVAVRLAVAEHGGAALDLIVDNDSPQSAAIEVPHVGRDGLVTLRDITWSLAPAGSAYEGRPALPAGEIEVIRQNLATLMGERWAASMMPDYLAGFGEARNTDFVGQHMAGRARVDRALGADLPQVRVSEAFGGPFLADLLLYAGRFATAYNRSLADYRHRYDVRSPDRPLPDLRTDGTWTETALWIYQPLQVRRRLWVCRHGDSLLLRADQNNAGSIAVADLQADTDAALRCLAPWRIRPRALTLTLWARLLACDLFVHGIGGAKYDRITDDLFRHYYHCPPPPYTCVSATLRLPLPRQPVTPEHLAAAVRRMRDVRFNPDRYLSAPDPRLLAERRRLIAESQRLRTERVSRPRRHEVFLGIHKLNAELVNLQPNIEGQLGADADLLARQLASNRLATSREFFYALHERDRLAALQKGVRNLFAE